MARTNTPRQAKQWDSLPGTDQAMTADNTFAASGTLTQLADTPFTVLRMLGEYIIGPTSVTVAGDRCDIGVGICVTSTDAFALGATALPDPLGEPDYPWLYWAAHTFNFPAATSGTAGEGPQGLTGSVRHRFDIRSMRKIKPRESLSMVLQYADLSGTPPMTFVAGPIRVLVGLH